MQDMLAHRESQPTEELIALRRENAELRRENAELRRENAELRLRIAELEAQLARLTKKVFGKSSEKMSRPKKDIEKQDGVKPDPAEVKKRRKDRDDLRKKKPKKSKSNMICLKPSDNAPIVPIRI
jgi:predicted RNase H-like nuclease (RuvC/YqgF family)